jgi:hypothetical protein
MNRILKRAGLLTLVAGLGTALSASVMGWPGSLAELSSGRTYLVEVLRVEGISYQDSVTDEWKLWDESVSPPIVVIFPNMVTIP